MAVARVNGASAQHSTGSGNPSKIFESRNFLIGPNRLLTERKNQGDRQVDHKKKGEGGSVRLENPGDQRSSRVGSGPSPPAETKLFNQFRSPLSFP